MQLLKTLWCGLICFFVFQSPEVSGGDSGTDVYVHFMPWYQADPAAGTWGWHWTMNHYNPEEVRWDGRRRISAHDYPLIGPYDSSEPLECQVLQMKLAGIDGVIIDWYGTDDVNDYSMIHRNTEALISVIEKAGMKFAICYEDQVVGEFVKQKGGDRAEAVKVAAAHLQWAEKNWFSRESYAKLEEKPVLLVFGPRYLKGDEMKKVLAGLASSPAVSVLPHLTEETGISGSFAWPPVDGGKNVGAAEWKERLAAFANAEGEGHFHIPVAFPGFQDIYQQAGLHESYGRIDSRSGETFSESLDLALKQNAPMIQIATWNDYGEGTVIEPTWRHGYRYLEEIQRRVGSAFTSTDLRLPERLLHLKRRGVDVRAVSEALFAGDCVRARELLGALKIDESKHPDKFATDKASAASHYRLSRDILYRDETDLSEYGKNRCRLDVYAPVKGKENATVVWFHGGGITGGQRYVPVPLRNKGVIVVAANYRLSPHVKSPVYVEDAAAAVAWTLENIEKFGGSPDRVFVSGHSAGGYLASMVALDPGYLETFGRSIHDLAGVIPFSGHSITHFTVRKERGIGGLQPVVDEMAPLFHVGKNVPPFLLITGDRDDEIMGRYEETAYFWRMMQEVGHPDTTLAELEGFDHGGMPEPGFPLMLEFMSDRKAGD
ncbi:MAG: carboxylesterase family protein [Verrucomicrobiales bacterium]|nr:carboxylesterase family protein [Verrucomicrobiales bacterium]